MRVLFDQGVPVPLREQLSAEIRTAFEQGWSTYSNGRLLEVAKEQGFDVVVTTDTNLRFQQNLSGRALGVVVRLSASWPRIGRVVPAIESAIKTVRPGAS